MRYQGLVGSINKHMTALNKKTKQASLIVSTFLLGATTVFAQGKDLEGIKFSVKSYLPFDSLTEFVQAILEVFIIIATPIVVLAIIYSGFLYVTARGNVEQTKKATTALTYAIIGGVIIIGSVAIAEIVGNVVESFKSK